VNKGIRDFCDSARYLLEIIGTWAADWFVYSVITTARRAFNPYNMFFFSWKGLEFDMVHPMEILTYEEDS
jgi:hypothetical protein